MTSIFAMLLMLSQPEWALKMEGSWKGQGQRIDSLGYRTVIEASAESRRSGAQTGVIISKNHFDETVYSASGALLRKRAYERIYWIAEQPDGTLLLGYGETAGEKTSSRGTYEPASMLMRSEQVIGGTLRVSVSTDLSREGRSEYFEQIHMGEQLQSEARISYLRQPE